MAATPAEHPNPAFWEEVCGPEVRSNRFRLDGIGPGIAVVELDSRPAQALVAGAARMRADLRQPLENSHDRSGQPATKL